MADRWDYLNPKFRQRIGQNGWEFQSQSHTGEWSPSYDRAGLAHAWQADQDHDSYR